MKVIDVKQEPIPPVTKKLDRSPIIDRIYISPDKEIFDDGCESISMGSKSKLPMD